MSFKLGHLCQNCGKQLSDERAKICFNCKVESFKGRHLSPKTEFKKGQIPWNKDIPMPEETRQKIIISRTGKCCGENHWNWIIDRTKLKKDQKRGDSAYKDWRIQVFKRDNFKCRINNEDCSGRTIAHHILGWSEFPELRYEVNNGITLCLAHHPRKRAEVKRLITEFQQLVQVSNVN